MDVDRLVVRVTCTGVLRYIAGWHLDAYTAELLNVCERHYARLVEQVELFQALHHYYDQFAHEYFSNALRSTVDLAQVVQTFRQLGGYDTPQFQNLLFRYERLLASTETVLQQIPLLASRQTLRRLQFVRTPVRGRLCSLRVLARHLQEELRAVDDTLTTVPQLGRAKLQLLQCMARYLFERTTQWHWRVYYSLARWQALPDAITRVFRNDNLMLQRFLALNLNDPEAPSKSFQSSK